MWKQHSLREALPQLRILQCLSLLHIRLCYKLFRLDFCYLFWENLKILYKDCLWVMSGFRDFR